jgi:hypothetical protein
MSQKPMTSTAQSLYPQLQTLQKGPRYTVKQLASMLRCRLTDAFLVMEQGMRDGVVTVHPKGLRSSFVVN